MLVRRTLLSGFIVAVLGFIGCAIPYSIFFEQFSLFLALFFGAIGFLIGILVSNFRGPGREASDGKMLLLRIITVGAFMILMGIGVFFVYILEWFILNIGPRLLH
jgi:hypothetical protein